MNKKLFGRIATATAPAPNTRNTGMVDSMVDVVSGVQLDG